MGYKAIFTLLMSLVFYQDCFAVTKCDKRVGALDIGSGSTKLKVALVDTCKKKIIKTMLERQLPVGYKDDLSKSTDQAITSQTIKIGENALLELVSAARKLKAETIVGVATSAFRKAKNGNEIIQKYNKKFKIRLKIISQEEEARIGFLAVSSNENMDKNKIIVWDIGGGSMQISSLQGNKLSIYQGGMASVSFKNAIIEKISNKKVLETLSPNPIGQVNLAKAIGLSLQYGKEVDTVFDLSKTVVGIGGVHYHSVWRQLGQKGEFYDQAMLQSILNKKVTKSDSELGGDYAATDVSNIILVLGFMQALGIQKVYPLKINLTDGVLFYE